MNSEEYKALFELEDHYWWFRGMRKIVAALLDPLVVPGKLRILDAGCGTGTMLSWLRRYATKGSIVGVDISDEALGFSRRRGERLLAQASVAALPLPANFFDLVVSFEVLDWFSPSEAAAAYAELARVLKPGGLLLVRLPAFQPLYSGHDRAIRTKHRYNRHELVQCLKEQNLTLVRATYANALLLPAAAVWRWLGRHGEGVRSDVRPLPKGLNWMNPLLAGILGLEATVLRSPGRSLPFGLSVLGIARKPVPEP